MAIRSGWPRHFPSRRSDAENRGSALPRSVLPVTLYYARLLFEVGRESDVGYLKPNKRLLPDIIVTKDALPRALDVANELFLLFEDRGHQVVFAPNESQFHRQEFDEREKGGQQRHYSNLWRPHRPTIVYLGSVAIGLTIFEMTEKVEARWEKGKYVRIAPAATTGRRRNTHHSWTTDHDLPSGRLCVQAYSPYPRVDWHRQWQEVRAGEFPEGFSALVRALEREATDIANQVEAARKQEEIEHQQWREKWRLYEIEEAKRKRAAAIKASREELIAFMKDWAAAKEIESFLLEVEERLVSLDDQERTAGLERLQKARDLLGNVDALNLLWSWRSPEERLSSTAY